MITTLKQFNNTIAHTQTHNALRAIINDTSDDVLEDVINQLQVLRTSDLLGGRAIYILRENRATVERARRLRDFKSRNRRTVARAILIHKLTRAK